MGPNLIQYRTNKCWYKRCHIRHTTVKVNRKLKILNRGF